MRGRKKLPSHLKLVKGTARGELQKKKRDDIEPEQLPEVPLPPVHLNAIAQEEWRRVSPQLYALRLLTAVDIAALVAYCEVYSTYRQADEILQTMAQADATKGLLLRTKKENIIQNPMLGIRNKALRDMVFYAAEFGMTPSARARINTGGQTHPQDITDRYFD